MNEHDFFKEVQLKIRDYAAKGDFPEHLKNIDIKPETTIGSLELDSLGRVTLLAEIADLTGRDIEDALQSDQVTFNQVFSLVDKEI